MTSTLSPDQEEAIRRIRQLATSDDHLMVFFHKDNQLEMARDVIRLMSLKLSEIALLAKTVLGEE